MQKETKQWKGTTRGGRFGQRILMTVFSHCKPYRLYWVLPIVTPVSMLINPRACKAIYGYFRQRWKYSPVKAWWSTYCNHIAFGRCMFDKFALWAGQQGLFEVENSHVEDAIHCMEAGKGILVATSHIGNSEVVGALFKDDEVCSNNSLFGKRGGTFHIMTYGGETRTIQNGRDEMLCGGGVAVIQASPDMSHLFKVRDALLKGGTVCVTCDRFIGNERHTLCSFLKEDAIFPLNAFALALHCKASVLAVFCLKEGRKKYKIHYKRLQVSDSLASDKEKTKQYVEAYAHAIEDVLKKYPKQWFNFYDFWEK